MPVLLLQAIHYSETSGISSSEKAMQKVRGCIFLFWFVFFEGRENCFNMTEVGCHKQEPHKQRRVIGQETQGFQTNGRLRKQEIADLAMSRMELVH
jgi:hypothetical protein